MFVRSVVGCARDCACFDAQSQTRFSVWFELRIFAIFRRRRYPSLKSNEFCLSQVRSPNSFERFNVIWVLFCSNQNKNKKCRALILDLWFAVVLSLKLNKSFVLTFCGLLLESTIAHTICELFSLCHACDGIFKALDHTNRKPVHAILDEQRVKQMRQYESQHWKNLFALNEIVSFDFFFFCLSLR